MTTEYIALPQDLTADETITRSGGWPPKPRPSITSTWSMPTNTSSAVLSLRELIVARPETKLADIMRTRVVAVGDKAPIEDAINLIRKYDLLAVPVMDEEDKLAGIITVDDVIDTVIPPRKRNMLKFS
jgi:Mg/Co/Ni transporter MgtE